MDTERREFVQLLREQEALAGHTTIALGGPADYFARVKSLDEVRAGLAWAAAEKLPVLILGGGSNLVLPDAGVRGLVLQIAIGGIDVVDSSDTTETIAVGAGVPWDELVNWSVARGLSGIECLAGIPGTVGATPIQNVGAYGQEVAQTIQLVEVLERATGTVRQVPAAECEFEYRQSRFKQADRDRFVVLRVCFRLGKERIEPPRYAELQRLLRERFPELSFDSGASEAKASANRPMQLNERVAVLETIRDAVLTLRRSRSMVVDLADPNSRSAGSFFMNPIVSADQLTMITRRIHEVCGAGVEFPAYPAGGDSERTKLSAAWLIERAGFLKGLRRPGAAISGNHCLALVNPQDGTESRRAILELAAEIQAGVRRNFGVDLHIEPEIYGVAENQSES